MTKQLDLNKPIRTRDGREVVIYCTDAPGDYPIHGRVEGEDSPRGWTLTGAWNIFANISSDLINVPEPVEVWVNIYRGENGFTFGDFRPNREQADRFAGPSRCGCHRIVIDNPEGFDE